MKFGFALNKPALLKSGAGLLWAMRKTWALGTAGSVATERGVGQTTDTVSLWASQSSISGEDEQAAPALLSEPEGRVGQLNTAAELKRLRYARPGWSRKPIRWRTRAIDRKDRVSFMLRRRTNDPFGPPPTRLSDLPFMGLVSQDYRAGMAGMAKSLGIVLAEIKPLTSSTFDFFQTFKLTDLGICKKAIDFLELGEFAAVDVADFDKQLRRQIAKDVNIIVTEGIEINDKIFLPTLEQVREWVSGYTDLMISVFREFKRRQRLAFSTLLMYERAAAYRAHLARRVKPAQRRSRIPRPYHARPRPPAAPTAPPLR